MTLSALTSPRTPSADALLTELGLIRAQGPDAASFLHGQLTQDIKSLPNGAARLAGFCSAKGRLTASFLVWQAQPETWLMVCSADLLSATLKRLSMFVLRANCKLTDASQDYELRGAASLAGGVADLAGDRVVSTQGGSQVIALSPNRWLCATPKGEPVPDLPWVPADAWRWAEVQSGVARIAAATADLFVPQMVNFELVGGVNFKKGCYPGQEVVARSQYRGTVKRRAMLATAEWPMHAGDEVFCSADAAQPAGTVVLAARSPTSGYGALVSLKTDAPTAGLLHVGSADGPALTLAPLPYELGALGD